MAKTKDLTIKLEWNENGIPVIRFPEGSEIELKVNNGNDKDSPNQVNLKGNKEGLKELAKFLLALSEGENLPKGFHEHFDSEVFGNSYRTDNKDWVFTIGLK